MVLQVALQSWHAVLSPMMSDLLLLAHAMLNTAVVCYICSLGLSESLVIA